MVISAWNWSVSLDSPDGTLNAAINDATEIGMGAPTCGDLVLSNGLQFPDCSPSVIWSDDSMFLAAPQWQPYDDGHGQRLLIISMAHRSSHPVGRRYSVLELVSFTDGIVCGVNSPANNPERIEVDTTKIQW